jgi:hypothetical protein
MTELHEAPSLVRNAARKGGTTPIGALIARTLSPGERHLTIGGPARPAAAASAAAARMGPHPSSPFVLALAPGTPFLTRLTL